MAGYSPERQDIYSLRPSQRQILHDKRNKLITSNTCYFIDSFVPFNRNKWTHDTMKEIDAFEKTIYYSILDDGNFYYAKCPQTGMTSQPFEHTEDLYLALEFDNIDWQE